MINGKSAGEKKTRSPRAAAAGLKTVTNKSTPRRAPANKFVPTAQDRQLVQLMAAVGMTQQQACQQIQGGICTKTFRLHFSEEWENGANRIHAMVAGNLFKLAMGSGKEAVTAAIFWAKSRMKWIDNPVMAMKFAAEAPTDKGPIKFTLKIGERPADDGA